MLTETSNSNGSVRAVSNSAEPRSETHDESGERADGDRRSVGESVVRRATFDFSNIAPSGSHEDGRAFHRFLQPTPPHRYDDCQNAARNRGVEKRHHDVRRAKQGADRREQFHVAGARGADEVTGKHQQQPEGKAGERSRHSHSGRVPRGERQSEDRDRRGQPVGHATRA